MVPTRPKKRTGDGCDVCAGRRHSDLTDILEWVSKHSGIDEDVMASFSEGGAAKILSIARYWIGSDGNTLPRLESWQVMHELPYHGTITEDVYSKLFKDVGRNEDGVQRYVASDEREARDGCYVLRTDRTDLSDREIWETYVTLTRVE